MSARLFAPIKGPAATAVSLLVLAAPAVAGPRFSAGHVAATPAPAGLAYLTGTERSTPAIWVANANGSEPRRLGPGVAPLLAPSGQMVAASTFGPKGPALLVYSTTGAATTGYLSLAAGTVQPLAWSPDSRYLAVALQSAAVSKSGSSLIVIDMSTKTVTTVAKGQVNGASFAPDGSDRIVYGLSSSLKIDAPVNLYIAQPNGSGTKALTRDGRSLNPVWGARWIAYDKERLRPNWAPRYDIWLRSPSSSATRKLTNVPANKLVEGLVPLAFSANGTRLLSEFEGQDTSAAWTVTVPSGRARQVRVGSQSVMGAGISSDGGTLLVDLGSLQSPPSSGSIATVPFAGGRPQILVAQGSQASWNR